MALPFYDDLDPDFKQSLIASAIMHICVFLIAVFGLPQVIKPEPIDTSRVVNIEFVEVGKVTATTQLPKPKPESKPDEPKKPEPEKPVEKPKPPEPKPEPEPPKAEEKPPEAKPEEVPLPDDKKEVEEKPKEAKPLPPKPKITKKVEEKKQEDNFDSLLKNLVTEPQETASTSPPPEKTDPNSTLDDAPATNLADRLTISEVDLVRQQLGGCWNVMSGAKSAENLVVEVKLHMNPDRTVKKATIVDQGKYNTDSFFRAAADSALRALRQPACSPLKLPEGKYNEWKVTIIRFDPSDML